MAKEKDTYTSNMENGDLELPKSPTPAPKNQEAKVEDKMVHALCCVKLLNVNNKTYKMHDIMYDLLSEFNKVDSKSYKLFKE